MGVENAGHAGQAVAVLQEATPKRSRAVILWGMANKTGCELTQGSGMRTDRRIETSVSDKSP